MTDNAMSCQYHWPFKFPLLTFSAATYNCLFFYFTTKIGIHLFLVERVYVIRGATGLSRKKDKMYWVNLGGLIPYLIIAGLTFKFHFDKLDTDGRCSIGIGREIVIIIISYDFIINVDSEWCADGRRTLQFCFFSLSWDCIPSLISLIIDYERLPNELAVRPLWILLSSIANGISVTFLSGLEHGFVWSTTIELTYLAMHFNLHSRYHDNSRYPSLFGCCF